MPCVRKQMIRGLIVIILSFAVLLSADKSSAASGAALLKFSDLYHGAGRYQMVLTAIMLTIFVTLDNRRRQIARSSHLTENRQS